MEALDIKNCRQCGDCLTEGVNWTSGQKRQNSYICRGCNSLKSRAYRKANLSQIKNSRLISRYGITMTQYNEMLIKQGSSCGVCGEGSGESGVMFAVDHDHDSGKVRGLLCNDCNMGIGKLGDNLEGVEKAYRYLKANG